MIVPRRALVSVHDKTGLVEIGRALHEAGVEILSTGGTARALLEADVPVTMVADVTGFPEVFDGRVKTLHPRIHGGILMRRAHERDEAEAKQQEITPIDLVIVSLYPFEATIEREGVTLSEAVEEIDIGGPAMIRAAAKNHAHVAVVTDPSEAGPVLEELRESGGISEETATRLAMRAFARTAAYDSAISAWLAERSEDGAPDTSVLAGGLAQTLRYGENPHQSAAAYRVGGESGGVLQARQVQGKELSYNNIADLDAAWCLVRDLSAPGCAIIKHANPCGAAEGTTLRDALEAARACDPVSAFGGIYAFNAPLDAPTTELLLEAFVECVIAPDVSAEASALLAKKKNVRVLTGALPDRPRRGRDIKRVTGGFLVQDWDDRVLDASDERVVTKREPTGDERRALRFAWKVARHVKSNAILFAGPDRTLGIGAGQMSRVDSVDIAVLKARKSGLDLEGSAVASDAFFPFRDGVDALAAAGASAVIQPGGSVRDEEVIQAADEHGIAMVFTGRRHFRH